MADRPQAASDAIDTRRYFAAIRRDLPLIGALAIGLLVFAVAVSLVLPKTYTASALVGFDLTQTNPDAQGQERNINTQVELVTQALVLTNAKNQLAKEGIAVDTNQLLTAIVAEPVYGKNVIQITASSENPRNAAAFANKVADAYVIQNVANKTSALDSQIRSISDQIDSAPTAELRNQYLVTQRQAIAEKEGYRSQVQLARSAVVPSGPNSPKPVRNGVLALFVGTFLGILLALLRDQLRPRFTTTRDLGQFLEMPVVAAIPELGRRRRVRVSPQSMRMEQEAYGSLSAALRLALPPTEPHAVMLTSSMHAEGKTTVASRIARQLAASGHPTLLVSGDLRWPRLDALTNVEGKPGFSDLIAAEQSTKGGVSMDRIQSVIVRGNASDRTSGAADVLPSGTQASDAARLLSGGAVEPLLTKIRMLGYTYVIVDATPLLGLADAKLLARACDRLLVVGRLERISVPAALDLRDELDRIDVPVLGLVAIGGNSEASPYYSGVKFVPASAGVEPQGRSRPQLQD